MNKENISDEEFINVRFEYTGEIGDHYISESRIPIFFSLGGTPLTELFRQFNIFLKQAGYVREYDNVLEKDLSDEEYIAVRDFLENYRKRKKDQFQSTEVTVTESPEFDINQTVIPNYFTETITCDGYSTDINTAEENNEDNPV